MPISNDQIQQFEEWIAKGKTKNVLDNLLLLRGNTQYKSEIILLSNKLKGLEQEKINNTISYDNYEVEQGKINHSVLLLLEYLKREAKGEKKLEFIGFPDASQGPRQLNNNERLRLRLRKYLPVVIGSLLSCLLTIFILNLKFGDAHRQNCEANELNLDGSWTVEWISSKLDSLTGVAYIDQDSCAQDFELSCQFDVKKKTDMLTFNSKIGGYDGNEIYFVFENSGGEKGVCSGELVDKRLNYFYVKCVDLVVGADTSNGSTGILHFTYAAENATK